MTISDSGDLKKRSPIDWVALNKFSSLPIVYVGYIGTAVVPMLAFLSNTVGSFLDNLSKYVNLANAVYSNDLFAAALMALKLLTDATSLAPSLVLLYACSVLLAFGNLLYAARCPKKILTHKDFHSYLRFVSEVAENFEQVKRHRLKAILIEADLDVWTAEKQINLRLDATKRQAIEAIVAKRRQATIDAEFYELTNIMLRDYVKSWRESNFSKPMTRITIATCYAASGLVAISLFFVFAPLAVFKAAGYEFDLLQLIYGIINQVYDFVRFVFSKLYAGKSG